MYEERVKNLYGIQTSAQGEVNKIINFMKIEL